MQYYGLVMDLLCLGLNKATEMPIDFLPFKDVDTKVSHPLRLHSRLSFAAPECLPKDLNTLTEARRTNQRFQNPQPQPQTLAPAFTTFLQATAISPCGVSATQRLGGRGAYPRNKQAG